MDEARIVLFGHNSADHGDRLRRFLGRDWPIISVPEDATSAQVDAALVGSQVMVSRCFDERHAAADSLTLLQTPGAGWEKVETSLLPAGCTVCNMHGHEIGISEYVILALLEWEIGLRNLDRTVRAGKWDGGAYGGSGFHGEVHGKSLGIVGYGSIGRAVATRANAMGMTVGAISKSPKNDSQLAWYSPLEEIDRRLPELDYLLICCALAPETLGLINRQRLNLMRDSAVLVNVGRAQIVEEDAIFEALSEGVIAGAILDVWYRYPTPEVSSPPPWNRPFSDLSNVILSPHASGWTQPLMDRKWDRIADNIRNWDAPDCLRNIVWTLAHET